MAQYINKSALVAEIERRVNFQNKDRDFNYLQIKELEALLSYLDTLEIKEVDLIKEVAYWKIDHQVYGMDETFYDIAKHFFELGIKAQKGE